MFWCIKINKNLKTKMVSCLCVSSEFEPWARAHGILDVSILLLLIWWYFFMFVPALLFLLFICSCGCFWERIWINGTVWFDGWLWREKNQAETLLVSAETWCYVFVHRFVSCNLLIFVSCSCSKKMTRIVIVSCSTLTSSCLNRFVSCRVGSVMPALL